MNPVSCLHPKVILNPRCKELILRFDKLVCDDVIISIDSNHRSKSFKNSIFKVFSNFIPRNFKDLPFDVLDNYFFVDSSTGDSVNLFIQVPCGKCDLCLSKRLAVYCQKACFAAEESQLPVWYVTLTYNDRCKPLTGASKIDLQGWKKRLRKTIDDFYGKHVNLKFCSSFEYGHDDFRPHIHNLVFGIPVFNRNHERQRYICNKLFQFCWRESVYDNPFDDFSEPHDLFNYVYEDFLHCKRSLSLIPSTEGKGFRKFQNFASYIHCFPKAFEVPKGYDPFSFGYVNAIEKDSTKVVNYILKYSLKAISDVDSYDYDKIHDKYPFYVSIPTPIFSHSMGLSWLLSRFDKKSVKMFGYTSIYDNVYREVSLTSYYLKKIFPTWSDLVPSDIRSAYYDLHSVFYQLFPILNKTVQHDLLFFVDRVHDKYPFLDFLLIDYFPDVGSYDDKDILLNDFIESYKLLMDDRFQLDADEIHDKLLERDIYFNRFISLDSYSRVKRFKNEQVNLINKSKL